MRAIGVIVSIGFVGSGCAQKAICTDGDFECLFKTFAIHEFDTTSPGPSLPLTAVDDVRLVPPKLPDGGVANAALTLTGPATLEIDPEGDALVVLFKDPLGCQPSYCMQACPRGVRCVTGGVCTPGVKDGLKQGATTHWVEFGSQPQRTTDFDLVVTPVGAPGCPIDVAAMLQAGSSDAHVGVATVIAVSAVRTATGGGGGGSAGGDCLQASTLLCTPLGSSGASSRCIPRSEFESATGLPLPSAPAPDGTTGCLDPQKGVVIKPCLPGSTCRVSSSCGGGSTVGGVCNP